MHEIKKLQEAKYFLSRMVEEQNNRESFVYNLSAFLSAARSVMQYAHKEVKKKGELRWYENHISSSPVSKFFKDKRNINIHSEPVLPQAHNIVEISATMNFSGSLSYIVFDKDGNIKDKSPDTIQEKYKNKPSVVDKKTRYEVKYKFDDWTGSEDILTLCQMYISELEKVTNDGIAKGFVKG